MPSFDVVNYSLRPCKSIQRDLVFDGMRMLQGQIDLEQLVYIGFGSIWFTDFVLAHRFLRVRDMISIERNEIGYKRAQFNSPYATVRVIHGVSSKILPNLVKDGRIAERPWMIWLDSDAELEEALLGDSRFLIEKAPPNSVLLITFNGLDHRYGHAPERPDRLRELLGDVVPDNISKGACKGERLRTTLAELTLDFMKSVAATSAREGGFVPSVRIVYKDSSPMVTVGGILPSKADAAAATNVIKMPDWPCQPCKPVVVPHLTLREAAVLQSQLPRPDALTRDLVRKLGFDLEDEQIEAFETYYRQYPSFAQIVS